MTQFRVFEAVARHGSFTRAGEELHLAQPTVSIQMKKLSGNLGIKVLEQHGRVTRLTDAGRELYAVVHQLLDCLAELDERLTALRTSEPCITRIPCEIPEATLTMSCSQSTETAQADCKVFS